MKIRFLIPVIIVFSTLSCNAIFGMQSDPIELFVKGNFFIIAWEYDGSEDFSDDNSSYFNVYYRPHGTIEWLKLSEYPFNDEPQFIISTSILDYGIYDFAVSYVNKKGFESEKHSSLESSAKPIVGWYVNWTSD